MFRPFINRPAILKHGRKWYRAKKNCINLLDAMLPLPWAALRTRDVVLSCGFGGLCSSKEIVVGFVASIPPNVTTPTSPGRCRRQRRSSGWRSGPHGRRASMLGRALGTICWIFTFHQPLWWGWSWRNRKCDARRCPSGRSPGEAELADGFPSLPTHLGTSQSPCKGDLPLPGQVQQDHGILLLEKWRFEAGALRR